MADTTHPLPAAMQALVERLLAFIARPGCTDAGFDALAVDLFAFQFAHNEAYRRFCQRRGVAPRRVTGWRDVPPVPISAFKEATLSCLPPDQCERVFMTSGTSRGAVKGRHFHPTIAVWDASMQRAFADRFIGGRAAMPMLSLFPDEAEMPNSSLARYLSQAVRLWGAPGSRSFISAAQGLDVAGVCAVLDAAVAEDRPVALLGASYSLVELLDALAASGRRHALPAGSRILDTGGYKGRSRALSPAEFYGALSATFGVPPHDCVNMYGMTELSSQFYDAGNASALSGQPSVKRAPHWVRTRVLDPLSGRELPRGERGLLAHCDLASFNASTAILTEDVGVMTDDGFLLLGRAEGTEAKGCSIAVEEFLAAARA